MIYRLESNVLSNKFGQATGLMSAEAKIQRGGERDEKLYKYCSRFYAYGLLGYGRYDGCDHKHYQRGDQPPVGPPYATCPCLTTVAARRRKWNSLTSFRQRSAVRVDLHYRRSITAIGCQG